MQGDDALLQAVAKWRAAESARPECLADSARARVLQEVLDGTGKRSFHPLAPLFLPFRRLALASALPAMLLAAVLGYWPSSDSPREGAKASGPALQASKVNGQVVFQIANGDRVHHIYRWQGSWELYGTTKGAFRDTLRTSQNLVIYRIE